MATLNYGIPHYDDPKNGDFWLKSSNDVTFRVSKEGLSRVSGVFRDMFGIHPPPDSPDGTEAMPLSITEKAVTLDILFPFALHSNGWDTINDSRVLPTLQVADICGDAIVAAEKYQFDPSIAQEIIYSLIASERFSKECPAAVYGLACRHGRQAAITLASKLMMDTPFVSMSLGRHAATMPISTFSWVMELQNKHINDVYSYLELTNVGPCDCHEDDPDWYRLLSDRVKLNLEATPSGKDALTFGMVEEAISTVKCSGCPGNMAASLDELNDISRRCVYKAE